MGSALDKAIIRLGALNRGAGMPDGSGPADARCRLIATLAYLGFMLSVPLVSLDRLLLFAAWPVASATLGGAGGYWRVFRRSLAVLPFIAFVGIFNPLVDHQTALLVGGVAVSRGWLTFASIIVRGLLSVQALLLLTDRCGFIGVCRAMGRLGVPQVMVTQLLLVNRYLLVLLQEAATINRARLSRSWGNSRMSLRLWAVVTGQLFLRSVARSRRIHAAMLARGFDGRLRMLADLAPTRIGVRQLAGLAVLLALFALLRFVPLGSLFSFMPV